MDNGRSARIFLFSFDLYGLTPCNFRSVLSGGDMVAVVHMGAWVIRCYRGLFILDFDIDCFLGLYTLFSTLGPTICHCKIKILVFLTL